MRSLPKWILYFPFSLFLLPKGEKKTKPETAAKARFEEENKRRAKQVMETMDSLAIARAKAGEQFQSIIATAFGKDISLVSEDEYRAALQAMKIPPVEIEKFIKGYLRARSIQPQLADSGWWPDWITIGLSAAGVVLLVSPAVLGAFGLATAEVLTGVRLAAYAVDAAEIIYAAVQGSHIFIAEVSSRLYGIARKGTQTLRFLKLVQVELEKVGVKFVIQEALD